MIAQASLFGVRSVDLFAGGGGASEGIRMATGQAPLVAVNHDPEAIAMHARNHPGTLHLCESVFDVEPFRPHGRPLDLLWASPDCTHFSRAKGSAPRSKEIRALAWVVVRWAEAVRPTGETFREWVGALERLGYRVEWRELVAADYGAPTTRKRLFLVARCDGRPIVWPEPTHGDGRVKPWRTAAECIDWSIPCPSIFTRTKPLAEKTQARIAEGMRRFLFEDPDPFLLCLTHGGRLEPLREPFKTITAAHRGERALVVPSLIETRNGERPGQAPRVKDLRRPMGTVTATGSQGALVHAWLAKHYTGVIGHRPDQALGTVTATDHHSLVAAHLQSTHSRSVKRDAREPLATVTATAGGHQALVAAFLLKYYGTGTGQPLGEPLHTIVQKARFGLVTVNVDGEEYAVVDIGMRMLEPRELARAQGFGEAYVLEGTKTSQIARIGNSVPPPAVAAVIGAQFPVRVGGHLQALRRTA